MINVITKSGSDAFHGKAFEFLRNTVLDARDYFSTLHGRTFRQNQFGGTMGGPIKHQKVYFFGDYQGTRTNEGIPSGVITVPSLADRSGNLSDHASSLTGTVSGPYLAGLLSQKLGYTVTAENLTILLDARLRPVRFPQCRDSAECVVRPGDKSVAIHSHSQYQRRLNFPRPPFLKPCETTRLSGRVDANSPLGPVFRLLFFR